MAAAGGQDLPVSEKQVGDLDRLLQQAAGIAAQIENDSAQAASRLRRKLRQRTFDAVGRALVEVADAR